MAKIKTANGIVEIDTYSRPISVISLYGSKTFQLLQSKPTYVWFTIEETERFRYLRVPMQSSFNE